MLYLLLIFFPISMAFSTFLLRRMPRIAVGLGIGTLIVELLLAIQVRVDDPVRVFGVTMLLSPLHQIFLFLFLGIGIVVLIAAWVFPHGENFSATGLLIIAQTVAILLMQDSFVTALMLVAIALTAVLAIVDLPVGAGVLVSRQILAAALKYLVLMVVAGILLYAAYVSPIYSDRANYQVEFHRLALSWRCWQPVLPSVWRSYPSTHGWSISLPMPVHWRQC